MKGTDIGVSTVRIARVRREFGLHGEICVESLGGPIDRFSPGLQVNVDDGRTLTIQNARPGPNATIILRCIEIGTPEQAATLRGRHLCVAASQRRTLGTDEWFVDDLVGLAAKTPDGADLGVVRDVEEQPAHPILVLETVKGEQLVPFVAAFVQSVDITNHTITITPWEWAD